LFKQILALDVDQNKAKTYLEVKIPEGLKRAEKRSRIELENYIVAVEHEAQMKLQELQAKQVEKERKELIDRVSLKIDKLFDLAEEAEKRQNYQQAEEFYKEVLKLTQDKKIKNIIKKRKNVWLGEIADERKETAWAENQLKDVNRDTKSNIAGRNRKIKNPQKLLQERMAENIRQREEAEKAALKAAEKKEPVKVAAVQPKEVAAEPVEQFYTRDLKESLNEVQELIVKGNELLEEKKFKQAYKFFKAAMEVYK